MIEKRTFIEIVGGFVKARSLHRKHRTAKALLHLVVAGFALGQSPNVGAGQNSKLIQPRRLPSGFAPAIGGLGDRLYKAGNERLVMTGSFTDKNGTRPAVVSWELPGNVRFESPGNAQNALIYSVGNSALSRSATQAEADLMESLVDDTVESFLFGIAGGSSSLRLLGQRFRADDGKTAGYQGPWYGNTSASAVNASGTWDPSYKAVYHMNDAVTTGVQKTLTDSTSNANGLTTAVSNGSSFASITGKISNAVRFVQTNKYNGSSAFSSSPSGAGTGPVTLEMWLNTLNPSSLDGGNIGQDIGILNQTGNGSGFWVMVGASATGNVNLLEGVLKNGSSTGAPNAVAGQAAAGNTWYHVVLSYDGSSTTTLYVNGTSAGSYPGAWTRTDGPISISNYPYGFSYRFVDFAIEEFRVSSVARSADWVSAAFHNQSSPKGFVTVGPEFH